MTTSAQICYNSKPIKATLQDIAAHLRQTTSWHISTTEWKGYGIVVPQLLVHTPVPFLIQIEDDPEYVPEEIREIIEWEKLDPDSRIARILARCDARLAVLSTTPDLVIDDGHSISASILGTEVDPHDADISSVLKILCRKVEGVIYDCVNGGVISPLVGQGMAHSTDSVAASAASSPTLQMSAGLLLCGVGLVIALAALS
ncbi:MULTISPECIES: hypothetical protein [Pseudomonas]|uniref:AbiTii domain-containing protein n=1 Tax=Pseudomonas aphyarum TaxID=2942629 RepID=A0ABT5PGW6_9PSED|nr:hypothetical protein [Pseudomonas aphyarum]MDD0967803.1 hypothetical protein [Pseudomonas aphyarum]MDD1123114.1 hypothetical protein [Pseudomonas aphyarum]